MNEPIIRALALVERARSGAALSQTDLSEISDGLRKAAGEIVSLSDALSVAAHDLRNPINVIVLCASTLRKTSDDPKVVTMADRIRRAGNWADRLVHDYLVAGVIGSGTFRVAVERLLLDALIASCLEWARELAAGRGVDVELVRFARQYVVGDAARLQQVVMNLLDNAIRWSRAGEKVTVTTTHDGGTDEIVVSVIDRGPGIPEHVRARMFDRFVTEAHGQRDGLGTGLGLYIAKSVVEAHGGRIWCCQNADGNGSTFSFTLRADKAGAAPRGSTPA